MCQALQEHVEAYGLGPDDLLFQQGMFAYVRSSPIPAADDEHLPPLVSKAGTVYEHGTKGARYSMNCHCRKCKAYAPTTSASGVISRGHSEQARERPAKLISGAGRH
jgi:hypothetical protein